MYHSGVNSTISVPTKQVSRSHRIVTYSSPDIHEDMNEVPSGYCVEPSPRQVVGVSSTAISYKPHKNVITHGKHRSKNSCPPEYAKPKKKKGLVVFLQNKAKKLRKQSLVLEELKASNDVECLEQQIQQLQCELQDVNGVLHKVIQELIEERQKALGQVQEQYQPKPKKSGCAWLCCGSKNDEPDDESDDSDNCEATCPEPEPSVTKVCENISYCTNKSDFASKLFPANQCSSVSQNVSKSRSNMSGRGRTIKKTVSKTYVDTY